MDQPTWWNRLLWYPNIALNPFVGSEPMVGLSIILYNLDNLVAKRFNLLGTCLNVWNVLSLWSGGAAKNICYLAELDLPKPDILAKAGR